MLKMSYARSFNFVWLKNSLGNSWMNPEMSEFRYGKGNELNLTGVISKKQLKLISNACGFFMKTAIIKIKIYI